MLNRKYEQECTFADTVTKVFGESSTKNRKIYLYSTQSLNFRELALEEMKKKSGKTKGKWTYLCPEFFSLNM